MSLYLYTSIYIYININIYICIYISLRSRHVTHDTSSLRHSKSCGTASFLRQVPGTVVSTEAGEPKFTPRVCTRRYTKVNCKSNVRQRLARKRSLHEEIPPLRAKLLLVGHDIRQSPLFFLGPPVSPPVLPCLVVPTPSTPTMSLWHSLL